jgi:8-oxo-dGTP diphosphatase
VLLTQRSATMSQPLLWEFPGGKLEPNESETECLIREIKEELNLIVIPHLRLKSVCFTYPDKTIKLIPYICRFESGTINLLEHARYKWVLPDNLLEYNWCPADIPIVREYLRLKLSS